MTKAEGIVELRVITADDKMDVYFWHLNQRYIAIHLDGDCEEFFIKDDPLPESLCAWAMLDIFDSSKKDPKPFKIEPRGNGLPLAGRTALLNIAKRANAAISSGQNLTINITNEVSLLLSNGWDLYLTTDYASNLNPLIVLKT